MKEENFSNISELSAVMTTETEEVQTTITMTTSSTAVVALFYFQCAVVVIGVVGAAANGLILYAMIASKQHKKQFLIFNQNVFDLCSCLLLVLTYTLQICSIHLTGMLGYWLCMMVLSENLIWCAKHGSHINLMSISIERYLKVVHPTYSKIVLRKWVIYLAVAFAWIISTVYNQAVVFSTSVVVDGVCYGYILWESRVAAVAYGIWAFMSFFVLVIFVFIFCYGRIVVVIHRQARVMAVHRGPGPSTAQTHSHHIQTSVIKTMIFVSAFFVITGIPGEVYYMMLNVKPGLTLHNVGYYIAIFSAFLYITANPFIYATKFDPVRHLLIGLIPCKK